MSVKSAKKKQEKLLQFQHCILPGLLLLLTVKITVKWSKNNLHLNLQIKKLLIFSIKTSDNCSYKYGSIFQHLEVCLYFKNFK